MVKDKEVLDFWFNELGPKDWFNGGKEIDRQINSRFKATVEQARSGEFYQWRDTIHGRLAEIILLDQFPRNIYRGLKAAFASDDMALALAQEAYQQDNFNQLTQDEQVFLVMPFMHAESLIIQEELSIPAFTTIGAEENLKYAKEHRDTIKKFGRFPYRNDALGRESTPLEKEYLMNQE